MVQLFGRRDKEELRNEALSAYLDGELSERERQRLEDRLSQDAALRAELRAIHHTVSLIDELPPVAAPRNFILTESMVEQRSPATEARRAQPEAQRGARAWIAPLLTVATTAVSLLFIAVLVGDLLLPGIGGLASAPAPMQSREQAPKMALEAAPTGGAPSEELEMESQGAADLVSPPPAPSEPAAQLAAEEEAMEVPEMALEREETNDEESRAIEAPEVLGGTPAAGGAPTGEAAALAAPTITSVTALTPTIPPQPPVVSEDELGWLEPTPSKLEVTPELLREKEGRGLPSQPWKALEIALGLVTLVLAITTVQAWRLRRS